MPKLLAWNLSRLRTKSRPLTGPLPELYVRELTRMVEELNGVYLSGYKWGTHGDLLSLTLASKISRYCTILRLSHRTTPYAEKVRAVLAFPACGFRSRVSRMLQ